MADGVKISSLTEATDAQMTDAGLIEAAVADTGSSTGFSSKKASFGRLAGYILNKFSGLSLAGASQTVKAALDSLNSSLTGLSSGTILDYVKSQVSAGVPEGHFLATSAVTDIPVSGNWFVSYVRNTGSNIVQVKATLYNDSRVIYNTHIGNYKTSTSFAREWTQEPTRSEMDAVTERFGSATFLQKTVPASGSLSLTFSNGGSALVIATGAGGARNIWIIRGGSAGIGMTAITSSGALTTATSGNVITFSNTSAADAPLEIMVVTGSVS